MSKINDGFGVNPSHNEVFAFPLTMPFDAIAHVDLATGKRVSHELPPGDATGEPIFVPRSADASEGDGWLLAVIYRGQTDRSEFVVFDAQDIAAGPITSATAPRRIPFGFHGNWVGAPT